MRTTRLFDAAFLVAGGFATVMVALAVPCPYSVALSFGIGGGSVFAISRRLRVPPPVATPWTPLPDLVGLTVQVYRLRDGTWYPDYVLQPNKLPPATAVQMLRQAAASIEDDWNLG